MTSWWQKKLGGEQPAQPPARTVVPSQYAPVLPQGMGLNHDRALQHYMERNGIEGQPQPVAPAPPSPQSAPVSYVGPNEVEVISTAGAMPLDGDPHNYHRRLWGWVGNPRGGAAETQQTGSCPACGSPRYFSRSSGGVMNKDGVHCMPKPECFECGYPNEQGTLGITGGVQRLPGVKGARQQSPRDQFLRPMAPDGSVATLVKY